jgi:hypothetical protein
MGPSCLGRTPADNRLPKVAIFAQRRLWSSSDFLLIILVLDSLARDCKTPLSSTRQQSGALPNPQPTVQRSALHEGGYTPFDTRKVHAQAIRELIARDKNHPSVVLWSIANEPESDTEGAEKYFQPLFDVAREADPTHPVGFVNVMLAPYGKSGSPNLVMC